MLSVTVQNDRLYFGEGFSLSFQRTLRIPDDGKDYPLPPGLGEFPICKVMDYAGRVPASWVEQRGVFIPLYQREALWLEFAARHWKPNAVKIGIGMINAISGQPWKQELEKGKDDYLVCPPQPWLDGIKAGKGIIRQFVAMPLGTGYTVEAQVSGAEQFGGIQIVVYEPRPGKFPDKEPRASRLFHATSHAGMAYSMAAKPTEMGLAAGGRMKQEIYPDPHGIETWDPDNYGRVFVHIVNSLMYREITGKEPPSTPISAKTYTEAGYPWFDLYGEDLGDLPTPEQFKDIKSVKEMDQAEGSAPQPDDDSVNVPESQTKKLRLDAKKGITGRKSER